MIDDFWHKHFADVVMVMMFAIIAFVVIFIDRC